MSAAGLSSQEFRWQDEALRGEALSVRFTVFVEEQKVPREEEIDAKDPDALHVLVRDATGRPVGAGRLTEEDPGRKLARLGRIAVLKSHRGTGAGRAVMDALLAAARRAGYRELVLSSQVQAIGFYERLGFTAEGPEYDDAGIPHRTMRAEVQRDC